MKGKKCPSCGKKVAPKASYCIYCSARFDDAKDGVTPSNASATDVLEVYTALTDHEDALSVESVIRDELGDTREATFIEDKLPIKDLADDEEENIVLTQVVEKTSSQSEEGENLPRKKARSSGRVWLVLSIIGFVLIAVFAALYIIHLSSNKPSLPPDDSGEPTKTQATISPERQAWLNNFTGQWVDELSVGKKDLLVQGGQMLIITDIANDIVTFDLYSHSGGEHNQTAFVAGMRAKLYEDTLHFTFESDSLGHSGEGYMQVHDGGINVEVLIKNIDPDAHSLSMNTVFLRQQLPQATGTDIRSFHDQASSSALGDPIGEGFAREDGAFTTYEYEAGFITYDAEQAVRSVQIDFERLTDKAAVCFECFDGTATYDAVKLYYGEAEQDYEELDTQIFLLHYPLSDTSSVTFTFDSQTKIIKTVEYMR